jgi:hypothetical protein
VLRARGRDGFPLDNFFLNQHLYWLSSGVNFFLCALE